MPRRVSPESPPSPEQLYLTHILRPSLLYLRAWGKLQVGSDTRLRLDPNDFGVPYPLLLFGDKRPSYDILLVERKLAPSQQQMMPVRMSPADLQPPKSIFLLNTGPFWDTVPDSQGKRRTLAVDRRHLYIDPSLQPDRIMSVIEQIQKNAQSRGLIDQTSRQPIPIPEDRRARYEQILKSVDATFPPGQRGIFVPIFEHEPGVSDSDTLRSMFDRPDDLIKVTFGGKTIGWGHRRDSAYFAEREHFIQALLQKTGTLNLEREFPRLMDQINKHMDEWLDQQSS